MSYYLQIGASGGPSQIASNVGYGDFGRWAEKLVDKFPEPAHLYKFGWSQDLEALRTQLAKARKISPPPADVAGTIQEIESLLSVRDPSATCCTVTDGFGK